MTLTVNGDTSVNRGTGSSFYLGSITAHTVCSQTHTTCLMSHAHTAGINLGSPPRSKIWICIFKRQNETKLSTTRAAHEYLLEAARVTVAGGLVGGQKINISRMFRREVFSAFVVMKSARWRKGSSFFVENWMCTLTQTTSPTQTKKQLANT